MPQNIGRQPIRHYSLMLLGGKHDLDRCHPSQSQPSSQELLSNAASATASRAEARADKTPATGRAPRDAALS